MLHEMGHIAEANRKGSMNYRQRKAQVKFLQKFKRQKIVRKRWNLRVIEQTYFSNVKRTFVQKCCQTYAESKIENMKHLNGHMTQ